MVTTGFLHAKARWTGGETVGSAVRTREGATTGCLRGRFDGRRASVARHSVRERASRTKQSVRQLSTQTMFHGVTSLRRTVCRGRMPTCRRDRPGERDVAGRVGVTVRRNGLFVRRSRETECRHGSVRTDRRRRTSAVGGRRSRNHPFQRRIRATGRRQRTVPRFTESVREPRQSCRADGRPPRCGQS